MSVLIGTPEDRISNDATRIMPMPYFDCFLICKNTLYLLRTDTKNEEVLTNTHSLWFKAKKNNVDSCGYVFLVSEFSSIFIENKHLYAGVNLHRPQPE